MNTKRIEKVIENMRACGLKQIIVSNTASVYYLTGAWCVPFERMLALLVKDTGEMIGDSGLTLQNINGTMLPEIGYHIRRDRQRKGYAREAAKGVRDWAFRNTDYPALYSYCKYTNEPSYRTAESIGMRFDCEYPDEDNGITHVSSMRREDWLDILTDNMIDWANERLGEEKYAGWCLSFIEDALEISNGMEIFG